MINRKVIINTVFVFLLLSLNNPAIGQDSLFIQLNSASRFEKVYIYLKLSDRYTGVNPDSALIFANNALSLSKSINYKKGEAFSCFKLGDIYIDRSDYGPAMAYYKQALVIFKMLDDELHVAKVYDKLSEINTIMGDFSYAIQYRILALEKLQNLLHKMPDNKDLKKSLANSYNQAGDIYKKLGNYKNAIEYYEKALNVYIEIDDILGQAIAVNNLGKSFALNSEYIKALDYYKHALALNRRTGNKIGEAKIYLNLGAIYDTLKNYVKAESYYNLALNINKKYNLKRELSICLNNLGKLYVKRGNYEKAIFYLEQSINYAHEVGVVDLIYESYKSLAMLYAAKQDYENAYVYLQRYNEMRESVFSQELIKKVSELQVLQKAKEQEVEITMLKKSEELKNERLRTQRVLTTAVAVFSAILVVLVIILMYINLKRRRSNQLLEEQNIKIAKAEQELLIANKKLKANAERFRTIVYNMPVMINAIDEKGNYIFWNKECEIVTGYTAEEVVNKPDIFEKLFINYQPNENFLIKSNKDFRNYVTRLACKDSSIKTILWSKVSASVPIPDWKDWIVGIDITEQKRFEESLIQEKALLSSLINSITDLIFYKDKNSIYLGANKAFCDFYGFDYNSIAGKTDFDLYPEEIAKEFTKTDKIIIKKKDVWRGSKWDANVEGKKFLFDTVKFPFTNNKGEILGLVGVSRDITERHLIVEKLRQAKEKAEESDRLKSAFLANMSHEIRTPMNAIIGFTSLLTRPGLTQEQIKEYTDYIISSGKNLLSLIDDIIDIAKIEAGQIKIRKTLFTPYKILYELYVIYKREVESQNKNIDIILQVDETQKQYTLYSDPIRFKQIMNNLLANAVKFTDTGYVKFGFYEKKLKNRLFLQFFVKDTGIGIPKEKQDVIFERFGQVTDNHTRNYGGTGLGLAISKSFVELLGGEISVESDTGKGANFYFALPFEYTKQTTKNSEKHEEDEINEYDWTDKTVLVVEDDPVNYKLVEQILEPTHINILWVQDGIKAVQYCMEKTIDIVLMDIRIAKINGLEATKRIRKFKHNLPIIAVTAFAMANEIEQTYQAGCNEYIVKPLNRCKLLKVLSKYLK